MSLLVNDKKVSDHHAIIPTLELEKADLSGLPVGERNLLLLVCRELLCAAAELYVYEAVTAAFTCGGHAFTAKGRYIISKGWREIDRIFRAFLKEKPEDEAEPNPLPDFTEGQTFDQVEAAVTEHFTAPPKAYTEDTLLSAMENAGKEDMPEAAERKGPGHPGDQGGDPGKAGGGRICGAQRQKPGSHQGRDQPGYGSAGHLDLSHAHGGVGTETDRHRQGRGRPRRFHGGDL